MGGVLFRFTVLVGHIAVAKLLEKIGRSGQKATLEFEVPETFNLLTVKLGDHGLQLQTPLYACPGALENEKDFDFEGFPAAFKGSWKLVLSPEMAIRLADLLGARGMLSLDVTDALGFDVELKSGYKGHILSFEPGSEIPGTFLGELLEETAKGNFEGPLFQKFKEQGHCVVLAQEPEPEKEDPEGSEPEGGDGEGGAS